MQKCLLFICFLGSVFQVFSQKDFKGIIIDAVTKAPIPYVNIGIVNNGIGTVCDEKGKFHLDLGQVSGQEIMLFSSLGYLTIEKPVSALEFAYNEYPIIAMQPSDIPHK